MLEPIRLFERDYGPIRYLLAPMSGITDSVFRLLMREMGSQAVVSELISAEGVVRNHQRTLDMMAFAEAERPVGIQLFGADAEALVMAAKVVERTTADFVDINFGCPVKKVVNKGGGSAWLKEPVALGRLLTRIRTAVKIPLTIKVRTGWDVQSVNLEEVVRVAHDCGVSWVAVHGRTRAQGYTGRADWELIRQVAQKSPIPVIGNGDLMSAAEGKEKIERGYAHAIMIGRGALKNPWIFAQLSGKSIENRDCLRFVSRHFDLATEKKDPRRALYSLKKFVSWYTTGYRHSSGFRKQIFETHEVEILRRITEEYFGNVDPGQKAEDGHPFLMGGHG